MCLLQSDTHTHTMTIRTEVLREDAMEYLATSLGTNDPDILLDIIQTYLTDGAQLVARMVSGLEANDEQLLFQAAHTLKSSSSILGAEMLSENCEILELALRRKQPLDFADAITTIANLFDQVHELLMIESQKLQGQLA